MSLHVTESRDSGASLAHVLVIEKLLERLFLLEVRPGHSHLLVEYLVVPTWLRDILL